MNHLASFALAVGLALLASSSSGCGGGKDGKLMVDHPIYEYQAPEGIDEADQDSDTDEDADVDEDSGADDGTEE